MDLVDVSNNNVANGAAVSLTDVRAAGYTGVLAKASEGTDFRDKLHDGFRDQAKALGMVFGSYHFAHPELSTPGDIHNVVTRARLEAEWFLACANPVEGEMIALDVEVLPDPSVYPLSQAEAITWLATFLDHLEEATGQLPLIYTSPNFWNVALRGYPGFGKYPLWLASWTTQVQPPSIPAGWSSYAIWQWTNGGSIPGYAGNVDLDRLNPAVDIASLQIGQQPVTIGDPYGPPYTAWDGDVQIASATSRTTAFTDRLYDTMFKKGQSTLRGTRRTA